MYCAQLASLQVIAFHKPTDRCVPISAGETTTPTIIAYSFTLSAFLQRSQSFRRTATAVSRIAKLCAVRTCE